MMSTSHNELTRVQLPALLHLTRLGYQFLSRHSQEINERDRETNILVSIFKKQFLKYNYADEADFQREFENIKIALDQDDLGRGFFERLQGKIGYTYINWEEPEKNTYHVAMEVTAQAGDDEFRPDLVLFINGLPLSYIEVKQPDAVRDGKTGIDSEKERVQKRFELRKFRRFNNITQLISISDNLPYEEQSKARRQGSYYATRAASKAVFNAFKEEAAAELVGQLQPLLSVTVQTVLEDVGRLALLQTPEFQTNLSPETPCHQFLSSLYVKERLLFLLRYGLVYLEEKNPETGDIDLQKHVMRYPQYFATRAIERVIDRGEKKGVIWHTQGSGKTALAYFSMGYLTDYFSKKGIVPRFYFVVDRLDLANQAFQEFSKRGLNVKRINSPAELNKQEKGYDISVVNIQKFKDSSDLTDHSGYNLNQQNIYFIDEAHRSYNEKGSYLPNLYHADQNAIKIALTGTPLITYKKGGSEKESRATTRDIFGDYIHRYYYNQSIVDGFTLRLMREDIETSYKENLREIQEQIQKGGLAKEDIFAHANYVSPMLDFILEDFNQARSVVFRDESIGGMIVCDSAKQARELHAQLEKRRQAGETGLRASLILHDEGDKQYKDDEVLAFKKGQRDLLIVYSMLLTGFDAPRLKRLYLGRKVKAHNLLQTLTRVNRPYKNYPFGYVIDFADISGEFDKTNRAYLEELNREYQDDLLDENGDNIFGSIFVSSDEIEQALAKSERVLLDYPTENLEYFGRAIDDITDRQTLNDLKKAVQAVREYYNMARLMGYKDLLEKIDIKQVSSLLNMISRRLLTLSLLEKTDDFTAEQLLNIAMSETSFTFRKIKEEELRLAANDLDDLRRRVAGGVHQFKDEKDPEWVNLLDEFKRIMKKHTIQEQVGYDRENLNQLKQEYERFNQSFEDYKRRIKRLTMKFDGDDMAARAFKHATGSSQVSDFPTQYYVLKQGKRQIDLTIGQNQGILDNEQYLNQTIRSAAKAAMTDDHKLSRVDFLKLVESLLEEYQGEYIS